jgi:hypothetical protein
LKTVAGNGLQVQVLHPPPLQKALFTAEIAVLRAFSFFARLGKIP